MTTPSNAKTISLIMVPTVTGSVSTFASTALIVSILRSNLKLSTVYRRLIFFLSAFDILQSLCQLFSTLTMPAGTVWGAVGNGITCDIRGFLATLGLCATVLYSLSLTVYFLLVVKFNMSEVKIKKYAEPFLHGVPIVYSLVVSISILATNNFNPSTTSCWIVEEPLNCEEDPDVECQSGGNQKLFGWLGSGIPVMGGFVGNCAMLGVIWWTYRSQARKNQAYGNLHSATSHPQATTQSDGEEQTSRCPFWPAMKQCPFINKRSNSQSNGVLANYLSRPSNASLRCLEDISNRAAAYVAGYVLTFIFAAIFRIIEAYGSGSVPFAIQLLTRFFYPLQGFFNVLIYTYPHVVSYRRNRPECSWFRAFWEVVKTGGDSDQAKPTRRGKRKRGPRNTRQSTSTQKTSASRKSIEV